ncbi:MAG: monothiol glutaredoxin [Alphaproteobacteria bacterium]|jgi:monothiol glutaredoxin
MLITKNQAGDMMSINEKIQQEIDQSKVVLFLKGTVQQPMCGFSARVIQILTHLNVDFKDINVLADEELRQGIKEFSNWPTIPQLYIDGEFVGGCDIITEMFADGELKELLLSKELI